jgi:hypothetical protein
MKKSNTWEEMAAYWKFKRQVMNLGKEALETKNPVVHRKATS